MDPGISDSNMDDTDYQEEKTKEKTESGFIRRLSRRFSKRGKKREVEHKFEEITKPAGYEHEDLHMIMMRLKRELDTLKKMHRDWEQPAKRPKLDPDFKELTAHVYDYANMIANRVGIPTVQKNATKRLQGEISELKEENRNLRERSKNDRRIQDRDNEILRLKREIKTLQSEITSKRASESHHVDGESESRRHSRGRPTRREENGTPDTSKYVIFELQETIEKDKSKIQEYESEIQNLRDQLENSKDDNKVLSKRSGSAVTEVESLRQKVEELSGNQSEYDETIASLHQEIENKKEVIRQLSHGGSKPDIKQLDAIHKKETDTIQQKLTELQKKFHLIQEERDNLRESEEKERQIGEMAQQKLEDAKREKEKLQERIEELERETPAIKTEEFDSLNLTSATASHEFHTIFKREWMDAFKVLSDGGLQENDILLGLHGLLTKCVGDAVLECSAITKRVCRYRYFQTDPSPTLVKMLKLAGLKAVVPHKTKQMLENISTEDHGIPIPVPLAVKTYVQRCTEMTLLVRMLFPQLSIVADMESSHLNTQQFEVFSGEGNLIDVVVWPYIMKNGTVVQKGYVKVRSSKQTPSVSKNKEGATGISKSNDISDNEDHKYSDIEGTLIYKRDDEGKDESRNDTGSESANSMAESLTNYDLTSDFLNSFSIRQQRREDDVAGK